MCKRKKRHRDKLLMNGSFEDEAESILGANRKTFHKTQPHSGSPRPQNHLDEFRSGERNVSVQEYECLSSDNWN